MIYYFTHVVTTIFDGSLLRVDIEYSTALGADKALASAPGSREDNDDPQKE